MAYLGKCSTYISHKILDSSNGNKTTALFFPRMFVYKHIIYDISVMENRLPSATKVFALRSVNVLRKYSSLLDVPMSFILASVVYTASVKDWCILHKAMAAHGSQNVWFRKLYMLFSRYILINTFDQIKTGNQASVNATTHGNQMNFRRQNSLEKRKTN